MSGDASRRLALAGATLLLVAAPAAASFHLMQIEQVIGGVCGDETAQAIQLRMRLGGQSFVNAGRLRAWDATGANPVIVIDFPADVANGAAGDRILVTSSQFAAGGGPTPDFTMSAFIPASYLAAGKLTFENSNGTIVYWSLSWGGASYTGANTGAIDNDADGNFGPPYGGALPADGNQALRFQGTAGAASTNNAADYALTSGAATFTNNAGAAATLGSCVLFSDGFESGDTSEWTSSVP